MALPEYKDRDQPVVPAELQEVYDKRAEYRAWWSGDVVKLAGIYGSGLGAAAKVQRRWFHNTKNHETSGSRAHVPLPKEIAQVSADLLASEGLACTTTDPKGAERLAMITDSRFDTTVSSCSVTQSYAGECYLRVMWDQDARQFAWIEKVDPMNVRPFFNAADELESAWVHRVVRKTSKNVVFREIIDYYQVWDYDERGVKITGSNIGVFEPSLYEGSDLAVGRRIPLAEDPATAYWAELVDENGRISTGTPGLSIFLVKNLPAPSIWPTGHIGSLLGRSDYEGSEHMFDELDENHANLVDEGYYAKLIVFASERASKDMGAGKGRAWDPDKRTYNVTKGPVSAQDQVTNEIAHIQPDIRDGSFLNMEREFKKTIIMGAGYSPQAFGIDQSGSAPATAREVASRDTRTNNTQGSKIRSARSPYEDAISKALAVDAFVFNTGVTDFVVSVDFGDAIRPDPDEVSQRVSRDLAAGTISPYKAIELKYPDMEKEEIEKELTAIREWLVFQASLTAATPPQVVTKDSQAPKPA